MMPHRSPARAGQAALELMLSLPVLLALIALLLAAARAGLAALGAAESARLAAWEAQGSQRSADALALDRLCAGDELVRRSATVAIPGGPIGLSGRSSAVACAAAPPAGSWDERDLPLSGDRPTLHPNAELARRIGLGALPGLDDLTSGLGAVGGRAAAAAERMREATDALRRRADELREQVERSEAELARGRETLDAAGRIEDDAARGRAVSEARAEIARVERELEALRAQLAEIAGGLNRLPEIPR
jgi:hypothetical protein